MQIITTCSAITSGAQASSGPIQTSQGICEAPPVEPSKNA